MIAPTPKNYAEFDEQQWRLGLQDEDRVIVHWPADRYRVETVIRRDKTQVLVSGPRLGMAIMLSSGIAKGVRLHVTAPRLLMPTDSRLAFIALQKRIENPPAYGSFRRILRWLAALGEARKSNGGSK